MIDLLQKNDDLIWLCEFCLTQNPIDKKVQIPTQDNMCYILDEEKGKGEEEKVSENQKEKLDAGQSKNGEGVNIIFCIDISGSMNCSVERKEPDQNTKYGADSLDPTIGARPQRELSPRTLSPRQHTFQRATRMRTRTASLLGTGLAGCLFFSASCGSTS